MSTRTVSLWLNNDEPLYRHVASLAEDAVEVIATESGPNVEYDTAAAAESIKKYVLDMRDCGALPAGFIADMRDESWTEVDWEVIASEFEDVALEG